jgi:hypothetical protein
MSTEEQLERAQPLTVDRHGLRAEVPGGWECRISKQFESGDGETYSVLHAATIPLVTNRADYGGGVVENLGPSDVFVSLVEFGPGEAGSALYPVTDALPTLEVGMFHRNQLQRRIRGQAGVQRFFTLNGRPFCLYVVLGSIVQSAELVEKANELVAGLSVEAL